MEKPILDMKGLLDTVHRAGEAIMNIYHQDFEVIIKKDGSPLTMADQCSNDIISNYLNQHYSIPIISEESKLVDYEIRKDWKYLWMIDPLDGTKEFIHKRREFTINIALLENGQPIFGLLYAPVFRDLYYAEKGKGAYFQYNGQRELLHGKSKIDLMHGKFNLKFGHHLKLILSRSHSEGDELTQCTSESRYTIQQIAMGSALKFGRIAHGLVDANIRLKPTMEWDTAAAQIILEESGKQMVQYPSGLPMIYNKKDLTNPNFVAF